MQRSILSAILAVAIAACHSTGDTAGVARPPARSITFAFYNAENLWDPADDPTSSGDDDFTPTGSMKWTEERLERKLAGLARAIRALDGMKGPDLIGMCEIENRHVLDRLVTEFLPADMYQVIHAESPDERGIDVGILYRPAVMRLRGLTMHRVDLGEGSRPTRDIMEATFEKEGRVFTVLANHWPSRRGGEDESEPRRRRAADVAAGVIDSLTALDPGADIVLMGDLNDEPSNAAVRDELDARPWDGSRSFGHRLINTAAPVILADTIGSYYYRNDWETIDQIMLSRGALDHNGLSLFESTENIFAPEFLRDAKADPVALPPHHTYIRGTLYIGGTSDHFPVFLRVGWG
jgi:predicted extracellular nuclease